jgi:hypothetical protein
MAVAQRLPLLALFAARRQLVDPEAVGVVGEPQAGVHDGYLGRRLGQHRQVIVSAHQHRGLVAPLPLFVSEADLLHLELFVFLSRRGHAYLSLVA